MGLAAGLFAAFLVAFSNVLVRTESDRIDMLKLNALRLLAASPVAFVIPLLVSSTTSSDPYPLASVVYAILAAVVGMVLSDTIYFKSQKIIGVSRAQVISNTYPIITMLLAIAFLGERPGWSLVVALALVVMGVYFLTAGRDTPTAEVAAKSSSNALLGVALALSAGAGWAVGTILIREGMVGIDIAQANQLRMPIVAFAMTGLVRVSRGPLGIRRHGWHSIGRVAAAGILGISIGNLLFLYNLQENGATVASLTGSLSALFAAPLAVVFLGERITWRIAMGMILCLGGAWLVLSSGSV